MKTTAEILVDLAIQDIFATIILNVLVIQDALMNAIKKEKQNVQELLQQTAEKKLIVADIMIKIIVWNGR